MKQLARLAVVGVATVSLIGIGAGSALADEIVNSSPTPEVTTTAPVDYSLPAPLGDSEEVNDSTHTNLGIRIVVEPEIRILRPHVPDYDVSIGLTNCGHRPSGGAYSQYCRGSGTATAVGANLSVAFECRAATPFPANQTRVGCYLHGMSNGLSYNLGMSAWTSGNTAVHSGTTIVPFQSYKICVGAGYTSGLNAYAVQGYRCF